MDKKTRTLLVVVVVLLVANGSLFLSEPGNATVSYDPELFTISDTSAISSVEITYRSTTNQLERSQTWMVNEQYKADPMFIQILMNVISQVKMSRSLSQTELNELRALSSNAAYVSVEGEESKRFWVLGNINRTVTYFMNEDLSEGFVGEIPGYSDYLGSIFELTTLQWRDRKILDGNWRSIQRLTVDYTSMDQADVDIKFDNNFFLVEGIAALDSNRVVEYLGQYEYLQANERIDIARFPRLDSLLSTDPLAEITLADIYYKEPRRMVVFPVLPQSSIQLVLDHQGEAVIFDKRRLDALLITPDHFRYQN